MKINTQQNANFDQNPSKVPEFPSVESKEKNHMQHFRFKKYTLKKSSELEIHTADKTLNNTQ